MEKEPARNEIADRKPFQFDPAVLARSIISPPLLEEIRSRPTKLQHVIIDINLMFKPLTSKDADKAPAPRHEDPRLQATERIRTQIAAAIDEVKGSTTTQGVDEAKTAVSNQYVFARMSGTAVRKLVEIDYQEAQRLVKLAVDSAATGPDSEMTRFRTIHHIWPDFELATCTFKSVRTVKVDAAQQSFSALGDDITWAVLDTGIAAVHVHFKLHNNIDPSSPYHADFTSSTAGPAPLADPHGHGTHVAGIIAGEYLKRDDNQDPDVPTATAVWRELDPSGNQVNSRQEVLKHISGMAPKCKLVSIRVLDEFGRGRASNVIAAIAHIQLINGYGRDIKIHGINLSLGHTFDPKWFACGHSPMCVEVNRLVKSGVVVVVAAGNTGYGNLQTAEGSSDACLDLTINDPGNAEQAITVGSTHREMPHMYGVSYFSSKGPTGDGRYKPDLVAPGEKIISCAAKDSTLVTREFSGGECDYFENSGTSMAAPHVSGAIAAFLSIRREFIGEAERIKEIFVSTATDLGRDRYFQGAGLVDLMRAIQSI